MLYVLASLLLMLIVFAPSLWVRWVMHRHGGERAEMPGTGGELAAHLLDKLGLEGVRVELTEPNTDHYSPADRAVRLSPAVHDGKSLAAVAVAAHEVGHAIQHYSGDARLEMRTRLAPVVARVGQLSVLAISVAPLLGLLTRHPVPVSATIAVGLVGLLARMLLHLVTLPTEVDASFSKALPLLEAGRYVPEADLPAVRTVLRAAAFTYLAAALADVLNLARWISILLRR